MKLRLAFALGASLAVFAAASPAAESTARLRPANWATPVIDGTLGNAFLVSPDLLRCEQPTAADIADLKKLGVKTVLNLRNYHTDSKKLEEAGFTLCLQRMDAGKITVEQLVAALRQFRDAPKPAIVHCWHGSDRTGTFVAAYRIVFQNWTREQALDEFVHGGFGYHASWYPNLRELLGSIQEAELRRRVLEP